VLRLKSINRRQHGFLEDCDEHECGAAVGNRICCNLPVFSDQFKQKPGVCEAVRAAGKEIHMSVERALRGIAGVFVLASVLLAFFHSRNWLVFTGFVGLNLLQSAFTNWCPMVWLLQKVGLRRETPLPESALESR